MISVIIPVLNEVEAIGPCLEQFGGADEACEVIVVDGGSTDGTHEIAGCVSRRLPVVCRLMRTGAGRARQMNVGAREARGDILLFLHVDTYLPPGALDRIQDALGSRPGAHASANASENAGGFIGGRFKLRMSAPGWKYRLVERGINFRDRMTGGFTGDQAIFVRRDVFWELGGYPEMPLCEDVEFVRRLKRRGPLVALPETVVTSSRRYEVWGPFRTAIQMWVVKGLYLAGMPAERLAFLYPDVR